MQAHADAGAVVLSSMTTALAAQVLSAGPVAETVPVPVHLGLARRCHQMYIAGSPPAAGPSRASAAFLTCSHCQMRLDALATGPLHRELCVQAVLAQAASANQQQMPTSSGSTAGSICRPAVGRLQAADADQQWVDCRQHLPASSG